MEPLLLLLLVKSQLRHRHPDGEETGYTTALLGLPSHDLLQSFSPFFTAEAPLSASPFLFLSFPSKTSQPLSPKNFPSEFFSVPAAPLSLLSAVPSPWFSFLSSDLKPSLDPPKSCVSCSIYTRNLLSNPRLKGEDESGGFTGHLRALRCQPHFS